MKATRHLRRLAGALALSTGFPCLGLAQLYEKGIQEASVQAEPGKIAFVLAGRLWLGNLSGGPAQWLPTGSGRVSAPVLGPDGTEVFFLRLDEGGLRMSLERLDIESRETRQVYETDQRLLDFDVDFERREVVLSIEGSGLQLSSMEQGTPRSLTSDPSDRFPRISPDGEAVAFVRTRGDSQDIWVLDRTSQEVRRVQGSIRVQERFDWSPDGATFVVESMDTGNLELWTLPVGGGAAQRVTDDIAMESDPSWTHGDRICFHRNRQYWCGPSAGGAAEQVALSAELTPAEPSSVRVHGARLLNVSAGRWVEGRDLIIRDGLIAASIPTSDPTPTGAVELDASGLYVLPGLIDMHTHYEPWMANLMLQHGVSVMRDLGFATGPGWILDERDFTRDGHLVGPQILAAGVVMNGSGPATKGQIRTEDPQLVARTVDWLADLGIDLIKVGSENTEPLLEAAIETAHRRSLPVWGHIALTSPQRASAMGQDGIEHLRGMAWYSLPPDQRPDPVPRRLTGMRQEGAAWWTVPGDRLRQLARNLARGGTGLDPTLTVMAYIGQTDPVVDLEVEQKLPAWILDGWKKSRSEGPMATWGVDDFRAFSDAEPHQIEFVRAFHEANGLITTGSDVGVEYVVPGLSIHQEMAKLVDAGLTPIEAVRAATTNSAQAARLERVSGSLDAGKWGNVVILSEDPLRNIEHTRSIEYVVQMGKVVYRRGR